MTIFFHTIYYIVLYFYYAIKLMNMLYNVIYFLIIAVFFSSCSQEPAPVVYNNKYDDKKNYKSSKNDIDATSKVDSAEIRILKSTPIMEKEKASSMGELGKYINDEENFNKESSHIKERSNEFIIYHTVEENEDLEMIAQKYKTTIEQIKKDNDFGYSDLILEGDMLKIRAKKNILNEKNAQKSFKNESAEFHQKDPLYNEDIIQDDTEYLEEVEQDDKIIKESELPGKNISFMTPVKGKISVRFGGKLPNGSINQGINILAVKGTNIFSVCEGQILKIRKNDKIGYGNIVVIKVKNHDDMQVAYAHLDMISVEEGQYVKKGQVIGTVGSSGLKKTEPSQLHIEIKQGNEVINPSKYIKF